MKKRLDQIIRDYLYRSSAKKKIRIFYIIGSIIPILVIDTIILITLFKAGRDDMNSRCENAAKSVEYTLNDLFDGADAIEKSVFINKKIYAFLDKGYKSGYDYYNAFNNMKSQYLIWGRASLLNSHLTFFSDNESIINGNGIQRLSGIRNNNWYKDFISSGMDEKLSFEYFSDNIRSIKPQRHIYLIKKFNFYPDFNIEKLVVVELDYESAEAELDRVAGSVPIEVVAGDRVVLSNSGNELALYDFKKPSDASKIAYVKKINCYGCDLEIRVLRTENHILTAIKKNFFIYLILIAVSFILPYLAIQVLQKNFTSRLLVLTDTVKNTDKDHLIKIEDVEGEDELAILARNYNDMADRINNLIESVYKHQIKVNEETVARQQAELLALRSQINPHFLFNVLESIRMHSLIKQEKETARMIENLAIIQRQYVEWNQNNVKISDEMNFVKAYLNLQKYRFGDRLSFSLSVEDECQNIWIPKLSIVTFVENACVHGIEEKAKNGWIFVRIYLEKELLVIEIEDTGIGMNKEETMEIQKKMDKASMEALKDESRIGMINACIRLKMFSHNKVVFEISSEEGVGTMVTVKFPAPAEGQDI
ncbi:MAG: histidine kinase [Lachnospiraceae bacterium]|nr:histidine kinase [Lachnospiraceae bacterium]